MARWGRPGLTELQKTDLWRRWRSGEGDSEMGRALGKFPASVFGVLRLHGGYTPARRVRAAVQLTLAEREEISRGLSAGWSLRSIARELSRAPSTISREVDRNGGGAPLSGEPGGIQGLGTRPTPPVLSTGAARGAVR